MKKCVEENIVRYIKYVRCELRRKEERRLDHHMQHCEDCLASFAYIEEIVTNKQKLVDDEKTLLLRYLSDPIWFYEREKLKQEILEFITNTNSLSTIKIDAINSSSANDNTTSKTNCSSSTTTAISNTSSTTSKSRNAAKPKYKYSLFATALILVFFSLSTGIYLGINKKQSLSFLTPPVTTTSSATIVTTTNLYQQLDSLIDQYSESKNNDYLEKASQIANQIDKLHNDKYGIDITTYYHNLSEQLRDKAFSYHQELLQLEKMPKGDKYEERLAIAKQLNEKFLSIGNIVESHKARLSIAKSLIKIHEYKEALQIIDSSLSFSTANNYLFFEGQFSLWKGKCLSVTNGDSTEIENLFRDALNIGKKIESSKLTTDSLVTLAAYYQINDLDSKALEIAKDILMSPVGFKDEMLIGLKQQAGLSAFKLGYHEASLNYLMDAVNSSIQNGNEYLIATSKTFLGLVLGELNNFTDSDKVYYEAKTIASTIKEESSRLEVLSIILGYQAKTKMTAGDFQEAEKLYQQTLTIDKQLGVKSDLIFYQLNSGLAMALDKQGRKQEAEKYRVVALQYQTLMLTKHEKNNCLLSFLPSNCAK